ncbi:MAG: magnesium transporter [Proteobacteria bacterium]|nr:magnesium transporter [Pseudomonadota bacterium]
MASPAESESDKINQTAADNAESQPVGLSDTSIEEIAEALHENNEEILIEQLTQLGPADAAELLSKVSGEDRSELLSKHRAAFDPLTFSEMAPDLRREILEDMPPVQVASLLSELESDDALDLILNLSPEFQTDIIKKLSARTRIKLEEGLSFPEESAGRLMQREFVAIPQFWTVGKTIDYLRAAASELPEDFYDLFVITPTYKVSGIIPLNRLVRSQRPEKLENLMLDRTHPIPAEMDQEEVAQIFRREDITSAPVVDESERLIGVITVDDILDVVDEEAHEDLMRLAGVERGDMYRAILSTTNSRFRWLFINLLTAILASIVISFFDATIEQIVALAILMPIVASMGGNAGTQALTVAVRALSTRELSGANTFRIVWKETVVGMLNGIVFAIIMGGIAALWFHSAALGGILAAAMVVNLICAGFFGTCIPILLDRWGSDPAISSAVFLTTITDIVGFFAFLGLAAVFIA